MIYAGTKGDLRRQLVGIRTEIGATEVSELDYNLVNIFEFDVLTSKGSRKSNGNESLEQLQ
jgi:hypothetical protein